MLDGRFAVGPQCERTDCQDNQCQQRPQRTNDKGMVACRCGQPSGEGAKGHVVVLSTTTDRMSACLTRQRCGLSGAMLMRAWHAITAGNRHKTGKLQSNKRLFIPGFPVGPSPTPAGSAGERGSEIAIRAQRSAQDAGQTLDIASLRNHAVADIALGHQAPLEGFSLEREIADRPTVYAAPSI